MSLFLLFAVKTEKSQNAKLNFWRQTSLYILFLLLYFILLLKITNGYPVQYALLARGMFNLQSK